MVSFCIICCRKSYFFHKQNYQNIPVDLKPGATGTGVVRLQTLLRTAGTLTAEPSGVFDDATEAAITAFQKRRGITPDGRPGSQTLLQLYRAGGSFSMPRLVSLKERA